VGSSSTKRAFLVLLLPTTWLYKNNDEKNNYKQNNYIVRKKLSVTRELKYS